MGSVIDYIECPRCKQENCTDEYYYKSGEQYTFCTDCGYHNIFRYKRDNDGKFQRKDESKDFDFDNLIPEEIILDNPFGAYTIEWEGKCSTFGVFESKADYDKFVLEVGDYNNFRENGNLDIQKVTVSRFIDDKIVKEVINHKNK